MVSERPNHIFRVIDQRTDPFSNSQMCVIESGTPHQEKVCITGKSWKDVVVLSQQMK